LQEIRCWNFGLILGLKDLHSLQKLILGNSKVNFIDLGSLTNLEDLELNYHEIKELSWISQLKKLKKFTVGCSQNTLTLVDEKELSYLADLPNLHTLHMLNWTFPNTSWIYIKELKSLKTLKLISCFNSRAQLMNLDGMLLESLYLESSAEISDSILSGFPNFPNLTNLEGTSITNKWITSLPVFPKVRILCINSFRVTNRSLKYFSKQFPSLTDLNLSCSSRIKLLESHSLPNLFYFKGCTNLDYVVKKTNE